MTVDTNTYLSAVVYSAVPLDDELVNSSTNNSSVRVQVAAPATLAEGFNFLASYNGRCFSVTVPPGGVVKDQKIEFLVPVEASIDTTPTTDASATVVAGQWKDGLFGCFNKGICSSHLWCAWCFRACALGQVMQRVGLNWIGSPVPEEQAKKTFHTVFFLATTYVLFSSFNFPIVDDDNDEDDENVRMINLVWISLHQIIAVLAWIWSVWALTKTRAHVRSRDQIPEGQCHGCEDLCCALFCNCCTIAQLSRHTEEDEMAGRRRMLPRNLPVVGNVAIV